MSKNVVTIAKFLPPLSIGLINFHSSQNEICTKGKDFVVNNLGNDQVRYFCTKHWRYPSDIAKDFKHLLNMKNYIIHCIFFLQCLLEKYIYSFKVYN